MDRAFRVRNGPSRRWLIPVALAVMTFAAISPFLMEGGAGAGQGVIVACCAAATLISAVAVWFVTARVLIGDAGIRIRRGLRVVDLGRPKKMRFGQFETEQRVSSSPLMRDVTKPVTHAWVAVEGSSGDHVLFTADRGMLHKQLDWPYLRPPMTKVIFFGDAIALRDAIGERITAS